MVLVQQFNFQKSSAGFDSPVVDSSADPVAQGEQDEEDCSTPSSGHS